MQRISILLPFFESRQVLYSNMSAITSDVSDLKDRIVIKLEAYKIAERTI